MLVVPMNLNIIAAPFCMCLPNEWPAPNPRFYRCMFLSGVGNCPYYMVFNGIMHHQLKSGMRRT